MKKILSIGAIGLIIASSTSIGALAAERPTNKKIQDDMIALFLANKSPFTYNITASTKVNNIADVTKLQNDLEANGFDRHSYETLYYALGLIDSNASVIDNSKRIIVKLSKEDKLDDLLSDVRKIAVTLRDIENLDESKKLNLEQDFRDIIRSSNSSLDVKFGKNINGESTMSIMQGNVMILQISSGNVYEISDVLGNNADKLTEYAKLLGFIIN